MASASSKFHVLAFPVPGQGHITPMMHLCKRIGSQEGFTVSFVNIDSLHQEMVKYWEPPPNSDIRLVPIELSWKLPFGLDAHALTNLGEFFKTTLEMAPALEDLIRKLSKEISPVRCIISDFFFPWTQDVANKFNIPRIILWPGSAAWTALEYHIPELLSGSHIFPSLNPEKKLAGNESVVDCVKGLGPLRQSDIPLYLQGEDSLWGQYSMDRVRYLRQASCVLVNSFHELEPESFEFMASELHASGTKFLDIGPMYLLDEQVSGTGPSNVVLRAENSECLEWLDSQAPRSVLYVSFGSIAVLSAQQFEEFAAALEALGKPFLWVIRPELIVGDVEEAYNGFARRTGELGMIVSWAPQLRVLEHGSIGGFLSHAGWNSVLESICNGVPLMCFPWGAEQNTNTRLVADVWKIGLEFPKGENGLVSRTEIEGIVRKVMEGEEGKRMKQAVEELKVKGRRAAGHGGRSAVNLESFLQNLSSIEF